MTDTPNYMKPIQIRTERFLSAPGRFLEGGDTPRMIYPTNQAVNMINPTNPINIANQGTGMNLGYYGRKKKVVKMTAKAKLWMQNIGHKGALHRQLGISEAHTIPITLLRAIVNHSIGSTVKNPTKIGRKSYSITSLLHARANAALNMRRH